MAQPLHLTAEPLNGLALRGEGQRVRTGGLEGARKALEMLWVERRIKTPSSGALVRVWTFRESQICQEIFLSGAPKSRAPLERGAWDLQPSESNQGIHSLCLC